jgi:zinc D-Ala-D-Ala carboxypeptidase
VLVVLVTAVAVLVGATATVRGDQPSAAPSSAVVLDARVPAPPAPPAPPGSAPTSMPSMAPGPDDDLTVFDDVPAVARLDPHLLDALRRAATYAADDGVAFQVNSGWRSREDQERLLREAVAEYGSADEAARWVATPDTSPHVQGEAVDVGRWEATAWLSRHGAAYGLCQVYRNEPWHYELRPAAAQSGCPAKYADPTRDPRMTR